MLTRCVRLMLRSVPWLAIPVFIAVLAAAPPDGQQTRMLRSPTVSATEIAFAYANNIWTVERAGGMGLISGRKAFQKPMKEGVALLNAIQDVYLCEEVTVA